MSNEAFDLKTYISNFADREIDKVNDILKLSNEELKEYNSLLQRFTEYNNSTSSTKEKGDSLEEIVSFILEKSIVFEVYKNIRTTSNEIDQLTRFNKKGIYFKENGLLDFEPTFLSECKNYNQKVSVTWVGKFYSLMRITNKNLGIMFSYHGISGKGWNDGIGLTKKIYLSDQKKSRIVDFNIEDFKKLSAGISFIDLINDKLFNLENDTNIESYIDSHPNESSI